VTSLELESPLEPPPTLAQAANSVSANFGRVFQRQMLAVESMEDLLAALPLVS
jgi:lipoyl(octanoyl) transferase